MSCLVTRLMDSATVARLLGVEISTLGAWRRRDYGPNWYRIGKKIKYAETEVRSWMKSQAGRAVGQTGAVNP
jgi:predicted site-specific integrase-resolvase